MNQPESAQYAIGQAVFIQTDTPDYAEEMVPFRSLEELTRVCSESRPNRILEKIIVYSMVEGSPVAVTLGFVSASRGQRPGASELVGEQGGG